MQRLLKVFILSTLALVLAPTAARADGYFSPFIGVGFGNNSGSNKVALGANIGWMGGGVIGGEVDLGYIPSFFGDKGKLGTNAVANVMGNLIIGVPAGGTTGRGVRPYAAIGLGLLRSTATTPAVTDNELGMDLGGGVMGFLSNHVGVRGDVRYFRNLQNNTTTNALNVDFGSFHFWRASIGVVLRP